MSKTCQVCGSAMTLRLARNGRNAGNVFWGCSSYPKCKHLENVQPSDGVSQDEINAVKSGKRSRAYSSANETIRQLGMRPKAQEFAKKLHHAAVRFRPHNEGSIVDVFDSRGAIFGETDGDQIRNWGYEYKRSGGYLLTDNIRAFVSVLEKHLHRGQEVLLDKGLEDYILGCRKELNELFENFNFGTFNSDAFSFDSEEEQLCWKTLESKNSHLSLSLVPQAFVESIIPNYQDTQQRVDFFGTSPTGYQVIEIDGAQHSDSKQEFIDESRDEAFKNLGIDVFRIPVGQIEEQLEKVEFSPQENTTKPEHIAHAISIAISRSIKMGQLKLDSGEWDINVSLGVSHSQFDQFFIECVEGIRRHLSALAKHFDLATHFPKVINVIRDGSFIASLGEDPAEETHKSSINIHFDQVNEGELPAGHLFYREFPSSFPVRMDVIDAPPINTSPDKITCQYFLNYFFRFPDFREGQWEGIERTLRGLDSLVLMPTGHGKSIIYQIAAMLRPGTALVIDPIISLIDDQIDNLAQYGITRTTGISSQLEESTKRKFIEEFSQGQFIFAFVAPERLQMVDFRQALRSLTTFTPISVVAIDEAHCVSEWGHDFRTSYLNLGRNCREFCASKGETPPLLGLTGTASRSVLKDVKRELDILQYDAVITPDSFDRSELKFRVDTCHSSEKAYRLKGILQSIPSSLGYSFNDFFELNGSETNCGLIFCPHVNGLFGVVEVAKNINSDLGIRTSFYSGKAPKAVDSTGWNGIKRGVAHNFKRNQVPLMVATSAFGMGIDKPNVRYCVHLGIPSSIESFYQEAGRAGRDRKDSLCFIIASNDDPARTAELLSETSSISAVENVVKEVSYKGSDDIIRSLFFHTGSFTGIENELGIINRVLDEIGDVKGMADVSIDASRGMSRLEKAVHRLVTIGYVRDYTVDYSAKTVDLKLSGNTPEELRNSILRYVKNYQLARAKALSAEITEASEVTRDYLILLTSKLLHFIYDTIELGRRRALLEMSQVCGTNATDESIRERILAYLERSEFDDQLDTIVDDVESQDLVSGILEEIASATHAQSLRGQVARFLESYPDHPSLLLLRATVECMCNERDENIVTTALENWARSATTKYSISLEAMSDSYNYAMDIISKQMPEAAGQASRTILATSRDVVFIRHVLKNARSDVERNSALTALVNIDSEKLRPMMDVIKEIIQ